MSAIANIRLENNNYDTIKALIKLVFEYHTIVNLMAKRKATDEQKKRYYELHYLFQDLKEDVS